MPNYLYLVTLDQPITVEVLKSYITEAHSVFEQDNDNFAELKAEVKHLGETFHAID